MTIDPLANIDPVEARARLEAARAAYRAAEAALEAATAAADEAGEPRYGGAMNHDLHLAEREAIEALLDAKPEYETAIQTYKWAIGEY